MVSDPLVLPRVLRTPVCVRCTFSLLLLFYYYAAIYFLFLSTPLQDALVVSPISALNVSASLRP